MTSADVPTALVQEIRERLDHYFKIVVCNLKDTVPKIIGTKVVYESLPELEKVLQQKMHKDDQMVKCVSEVRLLNYY